MSYAACLRWVFTEHNVERDLNDWKEELGQSLEYACWQLEKAPDTGKDHYQGFVILRRRMRLNQVKSVFSDTAHWEVMKRDIKANMAYVTKSHSRVSGPYEIGTLKSEGPGHRTDLSTYKDMVDSGMRFLDIVDQIPGAARYKKEIEVFVQLRNEKMWKSQFSSGEGSAPLPALRWWQDEVWKLIENQEFRTVLWIYDPIGNRGKSYLTTWMVGIQKFQMLSAGKHADIAYAIDETACGYSFDLCREEEERVPYKLFEQIKNGTVFTSKYESRIKYLYSNKLVVMSNFLPDKDKLSLDRWHVIKLEDSPFALDGVSFRRMPEYNSS